MAKYCNRIDRTVVDAYQFTKDNALYISANVHLWPHPGGYQPRNGSAGYIDEPDGSYPMRHIWYGDWIVTSTSGKTEVHRVGGFEALYTPVMNDPPLVMEETPYKHEIQHLPELITQLTRIADALEKQTTPEQEKSETVQHAKKRVGEEFQLNQSSLQKILAINNAIQNRNAKLSLDGKGIICVALDGTCSFDDAEVSETKLTNTQLEVLFIEAAQQIGTKELSNG